MRKLIRVDVLILDAFCLHALDPTETQDVYEIVVERRPRGAETPVGGVTRHLGKLAVVGSRLPGGNHMRVIRSKRRFGQQCSQALNRARTSREKALLTASAGTNTRLTFARDSATDSSPGWGLSSELQTPDTVLGDMKRSTGWVVVGVLALASAAALVSHPWSGPGIPTASEYSSTSDLARDLQEHGLGCTNPSRPFKGVDGRALGRALGYRGIGFLTLSGNIFTCSINGRPVSFVVIPMALVKRLIDTQPKPRYTDLQDFAPDQNDGATGVLRDGAVLVGRNWTIAVLDERDPLPVLSAIRVEIGGTLVATSSTTRTSSPRLGR
jgi:hypothetical protein